MKLYERFGKAGFHTSLVTSFGIDFDAYENMMLSRFRGAGCRNNMLITDGRMLTQALDGASALPHHAGRLYSVTGANAKGVFHPKITLQVGRKAGRLIVGSANVTSAGLAGNLELAGVVECDAEAAGESRLVASAWQYLNGLLAKGDPAIQQQVHWMSVRAAWLRDTEPTEEVVALSDGTRAGFFCTGRGTGIGQQFISAIGGEVVERLLVISPYWDNDLSGLNYILDQTAAASCVVLVERGRNTFPIEALEIGRPLSFVDFKAGDPHRFVHAKVIIAQTATTDHVLYGSANCTFAALGNATSPGLNEEACLYRAMRRDESTQVLALGDALEGGKIEPADLQGVPQAEPIPLAELTSRNPGRFTCNFDTLTWWPPANADPGMDVPELVAADGLTLNYALRRLPGDGDEVRFAIPSGEVRPAFARVRYSDGQTSALGIILVVEALRGAMRESRNKRIDLAIAMLDEDLELGLWLAECLQDIEVAEDALGQSAPTPRQASHRSPDGKSEPAFQTLSYDDFVAGRQLRSELVAKGESGLTGSELSHVRGYLNRVLALGETQDLAQSDDEGILKAAFDLGDEIGDGANALEQGAEFPHALSADPVRNEKEQRRRVQQRANREQLIAAVTKFQDKLAHKAREGHLTSIDMLKLRAMLMIVIAAGWNDPTRQGNVVQVLPTGGDMNGAWPRLLGKCLFTCFGGTKAPIGQLVVDAYHDEIPDDLLECWATCMWAIQAILAASGRVQEYHGLKGAFAKLGASIYRLVRLQHEEFFDERVMRIFEGLSKRFAGPLGLQAQDLERGHQHAVGELQKVRT